MNDRLAGRKFLQGYQGQEGSNTRIPTIEEIQKLIEYPDRRIKPIIFTMISSGIRIGAWDALQWKQIVPFRNEEGEVTVENDSLSRRRGRILHIHNS